MADPASETGSPFGLLSIRFFALFSGDAIAFSASFGIAVGTSGMGCEANKPLPIGGTAFGKPIEGSIPADWNIGAPIAGPGSAKPPPGTCPYGAIIAFGGKLGGRFGGRLVGRIVEGSIAGRFMGKAGPGTAIAVGISEDPGMANSGPGGGR